MDKADVALKIYERGIRYGLKTHSRFEVRMNRYIWVLS